MNSRPSGNAGKLSTALFVLAGSIPFAAFLFKATPILIVTVAPALLDFLTALLMLLLLLSASVVVYICVKWLWLIVEDDRYTRRYQRQMLDLDVQERKLEIEQRKRPTMPRLAHTNRSTDASIPVVMQQQRTRRLNSQRPDH